MNRRKIDNNHGILVYALMLMLGLLTLAGVLAGKVFYDIKIASSQSNNVQAKYMAYAGINKTMYYLTNIDPYTGAKDGSWRTTSCSEVVENVAPCTTVASASTVCTGGAPCKEVVAIDNAYGSLIMWVETSGYDIKITASGTYPTDSSGESKAGAITKTYRVKVRYRSYLESWHKLDEGLGLMIVDSSGNGHDYKATNTTAVWKHTTNCKLTTGHCMGFVANSYGFSSAESALRPIQAPNGSYTSTYAAWIYPTACPAAAAKFGISTSYTLVAGVHLYGTSCDLDYISLSTPTTHIYATLPEISLNTWTHIAVVNDGLQTTTSVKMYINGGTATVDSAPAVAYPLVMNSTLGGTRTAAETFNGTIDDSRLYNRALTQAEILEIVNAGTSLANNIVAAIPYGYVSVVPGSWVEM